jgi:hypothetical protein
MSAHFNPNNNGSDLNNHKNIGAQQLGSNIVSKGGVGMNHNLAADSMGGNGI